MSKVWLPNMTMTLVRRATARQPRNNFVFRTTPNVTKPEIKEYLAKVYGVRATRVATVNYGERMRRSGLKLYKQKPYKKVYVRVSDDAPTFPVHPQNPTHMWRRIKRSRKQGGGGGDGAAPGVDTTADAAAAAEAAQAAAETPRL